jgi:sec-independent protein translocase protein TatA
VGDLSPWHLAIIALVFVLLFGAKRLPDGARALGRSLRIFKSEVKGLHDDDKASTTTAAPSEHVPAPLPPAASVSPPVEHPTVSVSPTGQPPAGL